jgi:hypothetical protein
MSVQHSKKAPIVTPAERASKASPPFNRPAIADAGLGEDDLRLARIGLDLLAQLSLDLVPEFYPGFSKRDNRNATGSLERVDVIAPKGTRDTLVGYTIVAGMDARHPDSDTACEEC